MGRGVSGGLVGAIRGLTFFTTSLLSDAIRATRASSARFFCFELRLGSCAVVLLCRHSLACLPMLHGKREGEVLEFNHTHDVTRCESTQFVVNGGVRGPSDLTAVEDML